MQVCCLLLLAPAAAAPSKDVLRMLRTAWRAPHACRHHAAHAGHQRGARGPGAQHAGWCGAELRELYDLMLFVDVDNDLRLARRLRRDIVERGRDVLQVPRNLPSSYPNPKNPNLNLKTLHALLHAAACLWACLCVWACLVRCLARLVALQRRVL